MKTTTRNVLVVVSAAALVGLTATAQAMSAPPTSTTAASVAAADLDPDLATSLQFTREEERMARDLYAALAEVHDGARPMSRITNSEQQHFDRVGALLEQYGLTDPSADLPAGEFAFDDLQDLYDGWLAAGTESLDAAFQVGIALEERDIADLTAMIEDSSVADVDAVLSRLLAASEHHLAAFTAAAEGTLPTEPGQGMQNQNGPGMQNGRQNENGPGMQGRGPGQGPRQGDQRQGPGRAPGPQGQAQGEHDCYLTDDTDADDTTG